MTIKSLTIHPLTSFTRYNDLMTKYLVINYVTKTTTMSAHRTILVKVGVRRNLECEKNFLLIFDYFLGREC